MYYYLGKPIGLGIIKMLQFCVSYLILDKKKN